MLEGAGATSCVCVCVYGGRGALRLDAVVFRLGAGRIRRRTRRTSLKCNLCLRGSFLLFASCVFFARVVKKKRALCVLCCRNCYCVLHGEVLRRQSWSCFCEFVFGGERGVLCAREQWEETEREREGERVVGQKKKWVFKVRIFDTNNTKAFWSTQC